MPQRLQELKQWLKSDLDFSEYTLNPASADASFRSYYRLEFQGKSFIVMDAPPQNENSRPFVNVSRMLFDVGLNVPAVIEADLEQGFLLLSDLGSCSYLDQLNADSVERLYSDALSALLTLQSCIPGDARLPAYDRELLVKEMELFREWLLGKHLDVTLNAAQTALVDAAFSLLVDNALEQPRVCVHRDYHSRNLMVTQSNNPGILDFQDAVIGPVTYDLVSLLRDCYIDWPRKQVEGWALGYQELALQSGILREEYHDPVRFLRWFDLMGMQRHLKAAGIFARLNHRDGKSGYLGDIPRTLTYVVDVASRYDELAEFGIFVQARVMSRLNMPAKECSR